MDTLLATLHVWIDEFLRRRRRPGRLASSSDAELLTLAVAQVLLGVRRGLERRVVLVA